MIIALLLSYFSAMPCLFIPNDRVA